MSEQVRLWLTIGFAGLGTFATRAAFLAVAHRLAEPPVGVRRVLRMIPPAALAALVLPAFLRPEGAIDLTQPRMVAGLVATVVAFTTKNVLLTLAVGMTVLVVLERI